MVGRCYAGAAQRYAIRICVKIIRMAVVKKAWLIDPTLVRKAQKIRGTRTETEMDKAFRRHAPVLAEIEQVFPDPPQMRRK